MAEYLFTLGFLLGIAGAIVAFWGFALGLDMGAKLFGFSRGALASGAVLTLIGLFWGLYISGSTKNALIRGCVSPVFLDAANGDYFYRCDDGRVIGVHRIIQGSR